jgi:hypothetical protein
MTTLAPSMVISLLPEPPPPPLMLKLCCPLSAKRPPPPSTPGVRLAMLRGLRSERYSESRKRRSTTWARSGLAVSSSGASAVTVMDSAEAPSSSRNASVRRSPVCTSIALFNAVLKPGASTLTL